SCVGFGGQWRAVASCTNPVREPIDLVLDLVERPQAPLDCAYLVSIRCAVDVQLSGFQELDSHPQQPHRMSRVLAVIAVSLHKFLPLCPHVRTVTRKTHLVEL